MNHVGRERTKHVLQACFYERERTARIARFPPTMKTQAFRAHQTAGVQGIQFLGLSRQSRYRPTHFSTMKDRGRSRSSRMLWFGHGSTTTVALGQSAQAQTKISRNPNFGYHYRIHHALLRPGAQLRMRSESRMDPMTPSDRKPLHRESGSPKRVATWPLVLSDHSLSRVCCLVEV